MDFALLFLSCLNCRSIRLFSTLSSGKPFCVLITMSLSLFLHTPLLARQCVLSEYSHSHILVFREQMQPWCLCLALTGMPLPWLSERNREWSSLVPSRPSPTRNTGRCMRNSRTWAWWPATSPLTLLPPASSWQRRWDVMLYERPNLRFIPVKQHGVFYLTLHTDFSSRSWGACCTEARKLWERWRGSFLMKSITWETQVCTETTDNRAGSFEALDIYRIPFSAIMTLKTSQG